jgi:hypothetical protein
VKLFFVLSFVCPVMDVQNVCHDDKCMSLQYRKEMSRWREVAGDGGSRLAESMATVGRIENFLVEVRAVVDVLVFGVW